MKALYDTIGVGYASRRKPDVRISHAIHSALGDAKSVLNVGAGSGSYEPDDRLVIALEPSFEMICQRPQESPKVCQGAAEALPFADRQFDAAMAILTVHHWEQFEVGLREMRRVSKNHLVILTFDPDSPYFWLADYMPQIVELDKQVMPPLSQFDRILGHMTVSTVAVPHDCRDGFLGAYWRRPQAYLDPDVRAAISTFSRLSDVSPALERLENDLRSGVWEDRYGHLLDEQSLDVGYRLIVADCA